MAGVTAAAGAAVPTGGFKNPQSDPTVGVAGGTLGLYFASTAQASSTFGLSPNQVDWGTVALGAG
jgi:hypothetical protein